jgi:hypothetical protein
MDVLFGFMCSMLDQVYHPTRKLIIIIMNISDVTEKNVHESTEIYMSKNIIISYLGRRQVHSCDHLPHHVLLLSLYHPSGIICVTKSLSMTSNLPEIRHALRYSAATIESYMDRGCTERIAPAADAKVSSGTSYETQA